MDPSLLVAFAGLCLLLALTPGPDTFLVLRFSLGGTRAGLAAAAGSSTGSLLWALAVAAGLATLLEQSAEAFRAVKIAGGLYLLWLGLRALLRRGKGLGEIEGAYGVRAGAAMRAGLLSNVLNPKVGLFFIAVVPQFLPGHDATLGATLLLGVIFAAIGLVYFALIAVVAGRAVDWLRRPRVEQAIDRGTAGIIATLGVSTLVSATR
ncbi:LysE family translocator [Mumia sp. zg.B53]|uniref:LysE family translocator n=1 Tax=unclassified Mumia TaxID=2621872 RepID=UPI001C6F53FB|nr:MULTISPECIES: LysE family translocator [unclassified Mumia]MBW9204329.1 LysE family translocator [Mumia sp. zg.B17]MBW9209686.1 LysE family translocator [Mumia sp. zg.B21]MBW9214290.1 LysE family translocator [Mumia sp. zg.B53]MDD9348009.1 LysE family translocator [Mumia sp.]